MSKRASLAGAVLVLASCGHDYYCEDHDRARVSRDLARIAYDGGRFKQAKELFNNAKEQCEQNYDARIGLAHACRAYGNELYQGADQLGRQGKLQQAQTMFRDANENHAFADYLFRMAMKERSDDLDPHYGLGLLWYERCTSPIQGPWLPDDSKNRQRERDDAIKEFMYVVTRQKDSSQAHRYLGLTFLAADNVDEGARHLQIYHDSRQDLYNKIVKEWSGLTPDEKKRKDIALRAVEKEIDDVREVIVLEHSDLMERALKVRKKEPQTPAEVQEIAHLSSQQLILEGIIKKWGLTRLGEAEQGVVKRCREYLDTFNRGKLNDVLAYLAPRKGEEAKLRQAVSTKVERETRFRNIVIRSAAVSGEQASVGFVCDLATKQDPPAKAEVTLRWRLVGGQWWVCDHP